MSRLTPRHTYVRNHAVVECWGPDEASADRYIRIESRTKAKNGVTVSDRDPELRLRAGVGLIEGLTDICSVAACRTSETGYASLDLQLAVPHTVVGGGQQDQMHRAESSRSSCRL